MTLVEDRRQAFQIAMLDAERGECGFGQVVANPSLRPVGVVRRGDHPQGSAHRQLVISANQGRSGMFDHQIADDVERSLRVRTSIHKIADEYNPAALIIGPLPQSVQYDQQLIDLTVNITDHGDRSVNSRCQLTHEHPPDACSDFRIIFPGSAHGISVGGDSTRSSRGRVTVFARHGLFGRSTLYLPPDTPADFTDQGHAMRPAFAMTILFSTTVCVASPPDVKSLFPMGAGLGTTTEITASGKLNPPDAGVWCSDASLKFEIPEKGDTFKVVVPEDSAPGLHWVRFFNPEGATSLLPFVVGSSLPETSEAEPNNEIDKAQKFAGPVVVNGRLGAAGDVDLFAISVRKGQSLVAAVDSNWRLAAPVDMVMQVLRPDGSVVAQNDDDHGFDPLIALPVSEDGIWFVRVFGFPAQPNSSIRFAGGADYRYRLTMTTGPYANHAIPSVVSEAEETATVRLAGWNLTEELRKPIPAIGLSGESFGRPDIASTVPVVRLDCPVVVEVEPCDRNQPAAIAPGSVACGVIDKAQDEDAFQFSAKKGERLNFRVESRSLGFPLDAVLTVIDASDTVLVETDDASRNVFDPVLKFTARADGTYRVCIRDLFENGSWRFAYRLHCETPSPSVTLTVKSDVFLVEQGEALEIPVTVTRNEKFAEAVSISVDGLPEGVNAETVKSEAKGDSAKAVKLTLSAAAPFNGPIRIVGSYGEKVQVVASAPLATFKTATESLWLTVVPKSDSPEKK